MSQPSISILITTYNEDRRLLATVDFFATHFSNYPLIIVDDASTDNSTAAVAHKYPHIAIIRHQHNKGKTAAIITGLTSVTSEYVCLFDADLSNLEVAEVSRGFELISQKKPNMLVFAQQNDQQIWKLLNLHVYVSGERIIKTQLLQEFFHENLPNNYEVEVALHLWLNAHQLTYLTTPLHSQNQLKLRKWDPLTALRKSWQFYSYFFVPQVFFAFCRLLSSRTRFEKEIKKDHP